MAPRGSHILVEIFTISTELIQVGLPSNFQIDCVLNIKRHIIPKDFLNIFKNFVILNLKISSSTLFLGYPLEQELYQNLLLTDFVQRLLAKRCVTFMNSDDHYLLMTGERGIARDDYLKVGTPKEKEPLVLKDVISYDEIKLSAFLSVTSLTELLNDGNRYNRGVIEKDVDKIEREGVVVGVMGARFEKPLVMEYQDIVIDSKQNIKELGYGYGKENDLSLDLANNNNHQRLIEYRRLWQAFYDTEDVLYEKLKIDNERFYKLNNNLVFDTVMMKKRYAISFDTLLMESQKKAEMANKQAYIHIVGIGLGVWKIAEPQTKIFLECFSQRLKVLLPKLNNIGGIHFSWFHMDEWLDLKNNGFIHSPTHPNGGIHTFLSNRNPANKLKGEFENMLLIISYAWDGNALPGNEFWIVSLSGSNDPSTACSTLITELHNPHINTEYVNGLNLHIASNQYGVLHITDFVKKVLD
ncbi:hypothetical protein DOY81_007842 [Sarcophaga bullata]|nr:hypothetical protein DOY81_007842 [Sarcophaga bullata]